MRSVEAPRDEAFRYFRIRLHPDANTEYRVRGRFRAAAIPYTTPPATHDRAVAAANAENARAGRFAGGNRMIPILLPHADKFLSSLPKNPRHELFPTRWVPGGS
jgi:hypothetical protein